MAIGLDNIKELSLEKKLMIGIGLFLLLGYFYWFYLFQPALDKRAKLVTDLENINRQIVSRQQVAKNLAQYKKDVTILEKDLHIILAKLPEQKEIPRLLTSVSGAGMDANLDFILFKPMAPASQEFYAEIPVTITVTGMYNDIAVFFDSVANLPRIVNITNFDIRQGEHNAMGNILKADCLMKIYMFLEEANEETDKKKKSK
ncbi:MAG: type 4a pilus biogenesis protein PilO [Thermodesulfobacteriota bacterium]|nr:type 4a pilus biogenesis protein PilO [Thermodesulfobacteriota bacterium]